MIDSTPALAKGLPAISGWLPQLNTPEVISLLRHFVIHLEEGQPSRFLLADQIARQLALFLESHGGEDAAALAALRRVFKGCQEIFFVDGYTIVLLRPRTAQRRFIRMHRASERIEEISAAEYLEAKDAYAQGRDAAAQAGLRIDFRPYFRAFPRVPDTAMMGQGISAMNRHLAGQMYQNSDFFRRHLVHFLRAHQMDGHNLLANDHLSSPEMLAREVDSALALLADLDPATPCAAIAHELRVLGFEPGWGATAGVIRERLSLLAQVARNADPAHFERLLSLLPLARRVLMVSPHGWFAQDNVLGKPDTGGQVTYVLDQARALERELKQHFADCGLALQPHIVILTRLIPDAEGTTCDQPREHVIDSENCWILRVPFRDGASVLPHWISRFHIWPWLEDFAVDACDAVSAEFLGKPDLIIGHYSDGNLVAHRMAAQLGVTHCAAVHALEKTKYLFSDLRWEGMEQEYHFSLQFTADMIAYNAADFVISSSFREIGGTETEMGMFESYETFSMPGLYRVVCGMDPQLARYNIVPPGASEKYFFPYGETARRAEPVTAKLDALLFAAEPSAGCVGRLEDPGKPAVFAMSRVDKVKNLPGLVEAYGKSEELRAAANLVILSSLTDAARSSDQEEIEQIHRLYALIEEYGLHGSIRWCGARLDKVETGEVYRVVADRRGVFAQPAFMETFGLTVIEAMACGLPVVVTCFGGPAEIVQPGECGEVVNPNDHAAFAEALRGVVAETERWNRYSEAGVRRVAEAFSWTAHARKVLSLANIYSYWDSLDVINRQALQQYIHTLYHTIYQQRARAMRQG